MRGVLRGSRLRKPGGTPLRTLCCAGLTLLFVVPQVVRGQEAKRLTLSQCIDMAVRNNHDYRQAVARAQAVRGTYVGAWSNLLPRLDAGMSKFQRISNVEVQYFQGIPFESGGVTSSYSVSGQIRQSIFDPSGYYSWRRSRTAWSSEKEGLAAGQQDLALQVAELFFEAIKNERLVTLRQEALKFQKDQLAKTEALFELGAVPKADVLKARVNLSTSQRELIEAENARVISRSRLNLWIGEPMDQKVEFVYEPASISSDLPRPEQAVVQAYERRPDMRQLRLSVEAAGHQKRAAWWSLWPQLDGNLFYDRSLATRHGLLDFESIHDLKENGTWGYSVSLNVPIFDGLVTKGQRMQAAGNLQASVEALEQKSRDVELEVRQALLTMQAARASVDLSDEQIASAREELRLREAMYDHGAATILELIESRLALTDAQYQQITSETQLQLAWLQFQKAVGFDLATGKPF